MIALLMTRLPKIANSPRKPYLSDLSDAEWEVLKPLLPQAKGLGHPVQVDFRETQWHFLCSTNGMSVGNDTP